MKNKSGYVAPLFRPRTSMAAAGAAREVARNSDMGMPNISFGINPTEELITKLQSDKPSLTPDAIEGRLNQQSAAVKDLKAFNKQAFPVEN